MHGFSPWRGMWWSGWCNYWRLKPCTWWRPHSTGLIMCMSQFQLFINVVHIEQSVRVSKFYKSLLQNLRMECRNTFKRTKILMGSFHICDALSTFFKLEKPFLKHLEGFILLSRCCNPSLKLATKARACKGAGQEWAQESHFIFLGVQESVREWTPTLTNELPLWELESQWTSKSLEGNCRGQNSLDWEIPYIIENFLELRCLKWACTTHLDT